MLFRVVDRWNLEEIKQAGGGIFAHIFRISGTSGVIWSKPRNLRKPLEIKEKPPFLAAFNLWRCGELNPGPITEPSVFYVRSLLAVRRFFCSHRCRR